MNRRDAETQRTLPPFGAPTHGYSPLRLRVSAVKSPGRFEVGEAAVKLARALEDAQRLITEAGLRLLAPDVQKTGLWEGRKIADLADIHYVNLAPHNISGPLGTMAGVHLSAAIPNFLALEWHAASVPFFDALVKNSRESMIQNGKIRVPDAPGLGIELDLDVVYKYRKPGEQFFA